VKVFGELCKKTSANPLYFREFTESQRKKAYKEIRMILDLCRQIMVNLNKDLGSFSKILTEDVKEVIPYIDSILNLPYIVPDKVDNKPDVCNRDGCSSTGKDLKVNKQP
jgi:hypothetical protein